MIQCFEFIGSVKRVRPKIRRILSHLANSGIANIFNRRIGNGITYNVRRERRSFIGGIQRSLLIARNCIHKNETSVNGGRNIARPFPLRRRYGYLTIVLAPNYASNLIAYDNAARIGN